MGRTAKELIAIAVSQIGYREKLTCANLDSNTANAGSGNHTKYARDLHNAGYYGGADKCGYAWCDVFVDWCFYKLCGNAAEAQKMICQTGAAGAACQYSMNYYKNAGRFYTTPVAGDQVFFGNGTSVNHTGIVESVNGNTITTIEGNTSDMVARRTYSLSDSYIKGFGRPYYSDGSSSSNNTVNNPSNSNTNNNTSGNNTGNRLVNGVYTVQSGDSWWGIAEKFLGSGAKMNELATYNGKTINSIIHPGQKIKIPGKYDDNSSSTVDDNNTANTSTDTYTVKPGDSWWAIAEKFLGSGTKMNELATYNGKTINTIIHPGDVLKIPK